MRKKLILGILLVLAMALPGYASFVFKRYSDYPRQSAPLPPAYMTLAEGCASSNVDRLAAAKWIDMGVSPGRLLFLQWEDDETYPPMVSVCAYTHDPQGRYRVVIPEVRLYRGHYRMYEEDRYRFVFSDIDGDGDTELLVFSDAYSGYRKRGFYLDTIYDYSKDLGVFMVCRGLEGLHFPEEGFDPKKLPDRRVWGCEAGRKVGRYVDIR
jgi:hypothetical protein